MTTTQSLTITENLEQGIKQLPGIGVTQISGMLSKISHIEAEILRLKEKLNYEIENLAYDLTEEGDGWSYMEIWQTDLRGNSTLIRKVREITGEE